MTRHSGISPLSYTNCVCCVWCVCSFACWLSGENIDFLVKRLRTDGRKRSFLHRDKRFLLLIMQKCARVNERTSWWLALLYVSVCPTSFRPRVATNVALFGLQSLLSRDSGRPHFFCSSSDWQRHELNENRKYLKILNEYRKYLKNEKGTVLKWRHLVTFSLARCNLLLRQYKRAAIDSLIVSKRRSRETTAGCCGGVACFNWDFECWMCGWTVRKTQPSSYGCWLDNPFWFRLFWLGLTSLKALSGF